MSISGGLLLGALAGAGDASWRVFFIVGAVAAALGIAATLAFVRDAPERAPGRLDVLGAALLAGGLVALLLALTEGGNWGWGSFRVLGLAVLGVALLAAWFFQQRAAEHPLISVRHVLREDVRIPYAMTFLVAFGIYGALSAVTRLAQTPEPLGGSARSRRPGTRCPRGSAASSASCSSAASCRASSTRGRWPSAPG